MHKSYFPIRIFMLMLIVASTNAQVPSSARSRQVVERVEPRLKLELSKLGLTIGSPVFIRIFKEPAKLELWMQNGPKYRLFRTYDICKFSGKLGPKLKEGDRQAPEGFYSVTPKQMNPSSKYHLSFNLGYPNKFDQFHGRTGSALMVHGSCVSIGCYAVGDDAIEEIWTLCVRALENGQASFQVHCFPFRLSPRNLEEHQNEHWFPFWDEFKPIYESFEKNQIPPAVTVVNGKYTLEEKRR